MKRIIPRLWLVGFALFGSCDKENNYCDKDLEFCSLIAQNNYQKSLGIINEFSKNLNYPGSNYGDNSNLEKLESWLECKTCIDQAEINCFWCLYSNPPGGSIIFMLKDNTDTLQLNLIGSAPHKTVSIIKK